MADMDVAQADANYATVNVPFALGYTYEHTFDGRARAGHSTRRSSARRRSSPAPASSGVKYLESPDRDPGRDLSCSGTFSRVLAARCRTRATTSSSTATSPAASLPTGDARASLPTSARPKICFVNNGSPATCGSSSPPARSTLAPGEFGTIVVAYIFAAPVAAGGCPAPGCDVKPANTNGDLTILGDPARMAAGRQHDRHDDRVTSATATALGGDTDRRGDPGRVRIVPGSLLGKANTAQAVFDNKFLLPFAPDAPEFFLVPGNNQVTVLWRPSADGDTPAIRSSRWPARRADPQRSSPNPLYDPNFRQST